MVTFEEIFNRNKDILVRAGIENAEYDCRIMFEKAFGAQYDALRLSGKAENYADSEKVGCFLRMTEKRCGGYPLQYIIGEWEFMGLPFAVGEGVLIPRQDTETLVEFLVGKFKDRENMKVLDLCAGSGCIGISLSKMLRNAQVYAVEKSEKAFSYLEKNISLNGCGVKAVKGDIFDSEIISSLPSFDLIVCNPPYLNDADMKNLQTEVKFEPDEALYGGEDGLDFYRSIVRIYKDKLETGGMMAFEIGMGQEDEVSYMLIQNGFKNVRYRADLCGINRIVFGENIFLEND